MNKDILRFWKPQKKETPRALISRDNFLIGSRNLLKTSKQSILQFCLSLDESIMHMSQVFTVMNCLEECWHILSLIVHKEKILITVLICCSAADHFIYLIKISRDNLSWIQTTGHLSGIFHNKNKVRLDRWHHFCLLDWAYVHSLNWTYQEIHSTCWWTQV